MIQNADDKSTQLHLPCEGTGDGDLDIRFKSKTKKQKKHKKLVKFISQNKWFMWERETFDTFNRSEPVYGGRSQLNDFEQMIFPSKTKHNRLNSMQSECNYWKVNFVVRVKWPPKVKRSFPFFASYRLMLYIARNYIHCMKHSSLGSHGMSKGDSKLGKWRP